jgi:uncharacterized membrane protein YdbT with pleckstrin-like domain
MANESTQNKVDDLLVKDELLWHDRKRILGMPISFTKYSLDENRLYIKRGLFNSVMDELLLYRVLDVKLSRTLFQKIFRVGTINLSTADKTNPNLEIKNIKNSEKIRLLISNIVERERDEKRVMGKEMFGASGMDMIIN